MDHEAAHAFERPYIICTDEGQAEMEVKMLGFIPVKTIGFSPYQPEGSCLQLSRQDKAENKRCNDHKCFQCCIELGTRYPLLRRPDYWRGHHHTLEEKVLA